MSIGGNWDRRVTRRDFLGVGGLSAAALMLNPTRATTQEGVGAGYGPTQPDPRGRLDLPEGFRYRVISEEGSRLSDGSPVPGDHDGMVAVRGEGDTTILVRNHELRLGDANPLEGVKPYDADQIGGTTALVVGTDRRVIRDYVTSSGTVNNCAGGGTPWGTWLTCEEDRTTVGKKDHGYVFEVDPKNPENRLSKTPIRDMGRFSHEAVDIDPRTGIAYLTERFSLDGDLLETLPVPQRFLVAPEGQATLNQTFESLSVSPNGRSLFTAVEGPLASDGATADGQNRIRILRYENRGPGGFEPAEEIYYQTEPGQGVADIVALSDTELLLLERGFVAGEGNTARIYKVSLAGAEDVSDEPSLAATDAQPVQKELLVDLADCPPGDATTPETQANPLLDNYESIALEPRLPGGQRSLLLQSDDNFSAGQVTRVVALGLENRQLMMGR